MTKTEYREYLQGQEWQERRQEKINAAGAQCERCSIPRWLAEIAYDQDLNVHHKPYKRRESEDLGDLEVLCRRCHEIVTFRRSELRAPKKATCERCDSVHWGYRSSVCAMCKSALDRGEDFGLWVATNCGEVLDSLAELMVIEHSTDLEGNIYRLLGDLIAIKRSKGGSR